MLRTKEITLSYPEIWRVFISGSSASGKTYFARQLLQTGLIRTNGIYYFHPDIEEEFPTDWDSHFPNIVYTAGLPSLDDLQAMPEYSVVVLDDLFDECASSKLISYLFRVLSSKKKLHVVIMTQRYFEGGSNGLNLRNSSNFHVLMNNSDVRTNVRVGCQMGLNCEVKKAIEVNKSKLYPYILIDRTNQARVSNLQCYTNILDPIKEVVINNTVMQIVNKKEFDRKYEVNDGFAKKRPHELDSSDDEDEYYPSSSDFSDSEDDFESSTESDDSNGSYSSSESEEIMEVDSDTDDSDDNSINSDESSRDSDIENSDHSENHDSDSNDSANYDSDSNDSENYDSDSNDSENDDSDSNDSENDDSDSNGSENYDSDSSDSENYDSNSNDSENYDSDSNDSENYDSDSSDQSSRSSDANSSDDSDSDISVNYDSDDESTDDEGSKHEQMGNGLSMLRIRGRKRSRDSEESSDESTGPCYRRPRRGFMRRSRYLSDSDY